ncbi:MAG TPA: hypothetical protein ENN47_00485 [Mesotoga infera]|uniref:CRISPR type III-associated protein domain-containing protein n=1 Tax=Mesotoga infera TaxID=1236046 RepID=A0A7C1H7T2_9BACT|nr:hypothetical protein [Mesotoga infera]
MPDYNDSPKGYMRLLIPKNISHIESREFSHIDSLGNNRLNGVLRLEAVTRSNTCFTQGDLLMKEGKITNVLSREGTRVLIPGSSLKGAIRTYAEFLSNSCAGSGTASCTDRLCIVCSMFGTLGKLGRVQFNDVLVDESNLKITVVLGPSQWKGNATQTNVGKIYSHVFSDTGEKNSAYEVIEPGNSFNIEITLKGLTKKEFGLLAVAMGFSRKCFAVKLGRGKNIGFGSVALKPKNFLKVTALEETLISGEKLAELINDCANVYLQSVSSDKVIMENLDKIIEDSRMVLQLEEG